MYQQWAICLIASHEWRLGALLVIWVSLPGCKCFVSSLEEGTNLNKILGKSNDINIGNSHLIVI